MAKQRARRRTGRSKKKQSITSQVLNVVGMLLVGAVVVGFIYFLLSPEAQQRRRAAVTPQQPVGTAQTQAALGASPALTAGQTQPGAPTQAATSGSQFPNRRGEPWEFDQPTNSHWDPRPGHEHWHSGPPPTPEQRLQLMSQP